MKILLIDPQEILNSRKFYFLPLFIFYSSFALKAVWLIYFSNQDVDNLIIK
jgi:hypothetical protein